ncbi:hypothetical protein ABQD64_12905 [Vagococcus fluvialis]|uniref:hypothetical protein n=1 Tax=Vagococcus fluvialis TaxID=2738 RepID=UPI0032E475DF
MKKQNNDYEKLVEVAEKLSLEDFDQLDSTHDFSKSYQKKKQQLIKEIQTTKQSKWASKKMALIAILALIVIPTSVYAATEFYQWLVSKEDYKLNLSFKQDVPYKHDTFYKLQLGYLPEGMEGSSESNKYSFKETYAQGGLSFSLWQINKAADFTVLSTKSYEERTFNNHKAFIVNIENLDENNPKNFDTIVYLLFEKEGYILKSFIGNDVPKEEWTKVMENLSLEETTKDNATYSTSFDDYKKRLEEEDKQVNTSTGFLSKNSPTIHSIGESIISYSPEHNLPVTLTLTHIEILDNISQLDQSNFNPTFIEDLRERKLLADDGALLSFKQKVIKPGNGSSTIDKVIEERENKLKFVYLTGTIENMSMEPLNDLYFFDGPLLLKNNKKGFFVSEETVDFTSHSGEVDYLDSHGEGKSYYRMPEFSPQEKREFHFGYFVDETQLDQLFLPIFNYSGIDNLNQKDLIWFDLRQ